MAVETFTGSTESDFSERLDARREFFKIKLFSVLLFLLVLMPLKLNAEVQSIEHFYGGDISESRMAELNEQVRSSPIQPDNSHPRLYGTNEVWYQNIEAYEVLDPDCTWLGESGWGTIKNIKAEWDRATLGGDPCKTGKSGLPESIDDHSVASTYLEAVILSVEGDVISITEMDRWRRDDALEMVHLIRRMNYCHQISDNCVFAEPDIERLSVTFLAYEFYRLRNAERNASGSITAWHKGYQGKFFDLGSYPAFKLWSLILDTFWDSELMDPSDKQFVMDEMEAEIDSFIEIYHLPEGSSSALGRWALYKGNNWTVVLDAAALFWAITFWGEEPYADKAREVLDIVLDTLWFHRDEFLDDGAYTEGPSYMGASIAASIEINKLLMTSFGQPNHAIKWAMIGERGPSWMLEHIASDSRLVDFGDAWAKDGYSHLYVMDMLYWEELVGLEPLGTVGADACLLKDYFTTSYYLQAFYDPWDAAAYYARDFYSLVQECERLSSDLNHLIYPDYQVGMLRQFLPNATMTALDVTDTDTRNIQADQTFLAGNAVSNALSHREIDFGALIWSAYGVRLLSDWSYGELSSGYEFYDIQGSQGYYIGSDDGFLELSLKHISGELDLSRIYIGLKVKGITQEVVVGDYISTLGQDWTAVSIPLTDFGVSGDDWEGNGNGIEIIRLKVNGFVKNGEFGVDEIKLIDAQGNNELIWYGDQHPESLESPVFNTTPNISHPDALWLSGVETTNGAEGTNKWARFFATGSYSVAEIFYSEDPAEMTVKNYMDYLPIGANTLVLPNAKDKAVISPDRTNKSQFYGQTGQIHALDVDGKESIHMNGSAVYGATLDDGNLEYFHRYMVPLNDGNFVIVDSFKARPGKEDDIQEFWYSYKNEEDSCADKAHDVTHSIDSNGALVLASRCNFLQLSEDSESFGRITAASMNPGQFTLGAPDFMRNDLFFSRFVEDNGLYMINRLNAKESRRLARYVPDQVISEDIRVFLLQASTTEVMPEASVTQVECGQGICFDLSVSGGDSLSLEFLEIDGQYVLPGTDTSIPDSSDDGSDGEGSDEDDSDNGDGGGSGDGGTVCYEPTDETSDSDDGSASVGQTEECEEDGSGNEDGGSGTEGGSANLLMPVEFYASHPDRLGEPEKLFDEQQLLEEKPENLSSTPDYRYSAPYVNLSSLGAIPLKMSVETDSVYGRSIYVDEQLQPLSVNLTFELAVVASISELIYYDVSSQHRPGEFIVWGSLDNASWYEIYQGSTGEYRKWVSISVPDISAQYIRFEFPEENSAKGMTELLIYGTEQTLGDEILITPLEITSLHPGRIRDLNPFFDEQFALLEKPVHLEKTPELRFSAADINRSYTNDLPQIMPVETSSNYGRNIYVDEAGNPMAATAIIALGGDFQLTELMYYDTSSQYRAGRLEISYSQDGESWIPVYDEFTGEYRKWVSIVLPEVDSAYLKLDFHEENAVKGITEMLIYGKPYL